MTIRLRRATVADEALLFAWVNSPDSLASKLMTQGPIPRDAHSEWLASRLADQQSWLWIVESADGRAIGQVRIQKRGALHEVDIYVMPSERGRGVAQAAIRLALDAMSASAQGLVLAARIKPENRASMRTFERAGFRLERHEADHALYLRTMAG